MIKKIIGKIAIYSLIVFLTVRYGPDMEFIPFTIQTSALSDYAVYIILGVILRLVYNVIRRIIKTLTLPLNWFTIGLFGIILNVVAIYFYTEAVNFLELGITMTRGTIMELVIFSFIIWLIDSIF